MENSIGNNKVIPKSIDIFKLVMAYLIVAHHTDLLHGLINTRVYNLWLQVLELGVPFFFLSTGYIISVKGISAASMKKMLANI